MSPGLGSVRNRSVTCRSVATGIGCTLPTTILLEIGSIERFAAVGQFVSYAHYLDSAHTRNGKNKGEGNTKNGNKYLAWAFVEATDFARRYSPQAKRFYERKKARNKTVVAAKALAHELARACYHTVVHSAGCTQECGVGVQLVWSEEAMNLFAGWPSSVEIAHYSDNRGGHGFFAAFLRGLK